LCRTFVLELQFSHNEIRLFAGIQTLSQLARVKSTTRTSLTGAEPETSSTTDAAGILLEESIAKQLL
jgi:hypothetical protein